jgi:SOS response regulatory protein OraA/RecX
VQLEVAVSKVVDRLEELALLDDKSYGRALLHDELFLRNRGVRVAKRRLAEKGVPDEIAEELVAEVDRDVIAEVQKEYVLKKFRQAQNTLDIDKAKRRVFGQAARRGIPSSIVLEILSAVR